MNILEMPGVVYSVLFGAMFLTAILVFGGPKENKEPKGWRVMELRDKDPTQ